MGYICIKCGKEIINENAVKCSKKCKKDKWECYHLQCWEKHNIENHAGKEQAVIQKELLD